MWLYLLASNVCAVTSLFHNRSKVFLDEKLIRGRDYDQNNVGFLLSQKKKIATN